MCVRFCEWGAHLGQGQGQWHALGEDGWSESAAFAGSPRTQLAFGDGSATIAKLANASWRQCAMRAPDVAGVLARQSLRMPAWDARESEEAATGTSSPWEPLHKPRRRRRRRRYRLRRGIGTFTSPLTIPLLWWMHWWRTRRESRVWCGLIPAASTRNKHDLGTGLLGSVMHPN